MILGTDAAVPAPPEVVFRPMVPEDVPAVAALEAQAYEFPWSEGIFRDCLRVGYDCRVVDIYSNPGESRISDL